MFLRKLLDSRRTVAFRLTLLYAGVFTVSLFAVLSAFYAVGLYGTHGLSQEALSALREDFREYLVPALLSVILFSALVGWFMATRALSGIVALTHTAEAVAAGAMHERVPVKGNADEIDYLARAFNRMLERIETLIAGMRETNDNIAHDLRSPITRMRGLAEAVLIAGDDSDRNGGVLAGHIVEECDRLLAMINTMLDIAESEAGLMRLNVEKVDIMSVIKDAVDLFRPLAEDGGVDMAVLGPDALWLDSDKGKLQRVLGNLIDNAIKFNRRRGSVLITAKVDRDRVAMEIGDTGIGISQEDLTHVFDRFFRSEKSRSMPGSGLGLSLARAFVESMGGSVTASSVPGEGSVFTVMLPCGHVLS